MSSVAFDTLEASKRLREDGFDEEQANALVHAFAGNRLQGLATRHDVARLKDDLKHVVESIRSNMANMGESIRKDMATLQERPTFRLGVLMIAVLSAFSLIDCFFSPAEPQRRAATVEARLTPDRGDNRTNVVKMARAIRTLDGTVSQTALYDKGVGTGGIRDRIVGGASGAGLTEPLSLFRISSGRMN